MRFSTIFSSAAATALAAGAGPTVTLPNARPPVELRKFSSQALEDYIAEVQTAVIGDKSDAYGPNIATMFANTFPSTLDTTVVWFNNDTVLPQTFVITGDINAMWLRDSMNQVLHYCPIMVKDPELEKLVRGVVHMQAYFMTVSTFANAFKAPDFTGIDSGTANGINDEVYTYEGPIDYNKVWECKYELDSLASFFKLFTTWYENCDETKYAFCDDAKDKIWQDPNFENGMNRVIQTMKNMQKGTRDDGWPFYWFKRTSNAPTETQANSGQGNPTQFTGMVQSMFRPSDDATIFQFLVPSNVMALVALQKLTTMLPDLATKHGCTWCGATGTIVTDLTALASDIQDGLTKYASVSVLDSTSKPVTVYAFEVDGLGSQNIMDDANVPSLLSLPEMGYKTITDPTYVATRARILSSLNGYYSTGSTITGIGSPHSGLGRPWMMALAMDALTSDPTVDAAHIKSIIYELTEQTGSTGLMHESISQDGGGDYTRQWFAWANTVFGQLIIKVYGAGL